MLHETLCGLTTIYVLPKCNSIQSHGGMDKNPSTHRTTSHCTHTHTHMHHTKKTTIGSLNCHFYDSCFSFFLKCTELPEVALKVDGGTDQCSRGEDINFEFLWFSVYGQVCSPILYIAAYKMVSVLVVV